jgi:hypothetical protein
MKEVVNSTIFHRQNPTYHTGVGTIPAIMLVLLLFGFVKIIPCDDSTLQRRPITLKIMVEVGEKE